MGGRAIYGDDAWRLDEACGEGEFERMFCEAAWEDNRVT